MTSTDPLELTGAARRSCQALGLDVGRLQTHIVGQSAFSSPRWDNFRSLSIPLDLAAQAGRVLIQDPVRRDRALVPVLDFPEYSLNLIVDRARARVRDRNHFGSHRVCEIRRRTGGQFRRTQGDLSALFHGSSSHVAKLAGFQASRECVRLSYAC
jgi:hypothetical protein